ncbi:MAG TPA: septum formation initiator family protein [Candidatus Polarisedimenticolia bacterium]|nr:septum formation initiator family protein [Candidatus Polarisedimenticolia bacterium]
MRSPYQSPKDAPSRRFLRLPPTEFKKKRRRVLVWGAGLLLGYLVYAFVGGDSGLIRIRALQHETAALRVRKAALIADADRAERTRTDTSKDPLLTERVARERFHMVKKDEILYRYPAEEDSAR